jgi:hypothetical protein
MSSRELQRVGILARVKSKQLKLRDAADLMAVSYRQAKRLWNRYRKRGAGGLKHASVGRESNRAKPKKFRLQVMGLVRKKYSGEEGKPGQHWRPSIWKPKMVGAWMGKHCGGGCWKRDCGVGRGGVGHTARDGSARRILENWCSWTEAFLSGWKDGDPEVA